VGGELFMLDMGQPLKIADIVKRIIRLRGLRVGKDIEVVYTGLRPGEKLTEELVFPAEQVHPTTSEAIFRVEDPVSPDLDDLEASIAILTQAAKRDDTQALHGLLAQVATGENLSGQSGRIRYAHTESAG
jgi:FlaA1/EpsC-like NDP-sugar epimerase